RLGRIYVVFQYHGAGESGSSCNHALVSVTRGYQALRQNTALWPVALLDVETVSAEGAECITANGQQHHLGAAETGTGITLSAGIGCTANKKFTQRLMSHIGGGDFQCSAAGNRHADAGNDTLFYQVFPGVFLHFLQNALVACTGYGVARYIVVVGLGHTACGFTGTTGNRKAGRCGSGQTINVPVQTEIITHVFVDELGLKYRVGGEVTNGVGIGLHVVQDFDAGDLVVQVYTNQHQYRGAVTVLHRWFSRGQEHITNQHFFTGFRIGAITTPYRWSAFPVGKPLGLPQYLWQPVSIDCRGERGSYRVAFHRLAWWLG